MRHILAFVVFSRATLSASQLSSSFLQEHIDEEHDYVGDMGSGSGDPGGGAEPQADDDTSTSIGETSLVVLLLLTVAASAAVIYTCIGNNYTICPLRRPRNYKFVYVYGVCNL